MGAGGVELSRRRLLRLGALGGMAAVAAGCGARRLEVGTTTTSVPPSPATTTTSSPPALSTTVPPPTNTTTLPPPATTVPPTTVPPTTVPATTVPPTTVPATTVPPTTEPATTVPPTTEPATTVPPTTTTSAAVPPTRADWAALAGHLNGRLSLPATPTYRTDLELYDPQYDNVRPAAIAFCANATDVARCIGFARDHALAVAARSGGHSYAGYSTTTGLVIDVSLMSGVTSSGGTAIVGAGARLIDVYSGLAGQGLSIPAGSCPTVGIAGLALGGGIGVMGRLQGVTCDHIVALEVVTAAGEIVHADATTNPDLFWACRGGGGGNFGVVTEFRFSTFPTTDVSLFGLSWPWAAAGQLLPAWLEWVAGAPDELWSNCVFEAGGGSGGAYIQVGGVWAGGQADAGPQVAKLIAVVGQPSSQAVGSNGFEDAMYVEAGCRDLSQTACHLAGESPGGTLPRTVTVAKSDFVNRALTDAGTQAVLDGIDQRHQQGAPGSVAFDSSGGAVNRVAPDATAFVHRRAIASAQYLVDFSEGVGAGAVRSARAWLDGWYSSLRPYMSGEAYQNYIDPGLANWGLRLLRRQPAPPPAGQSQMGPRRLLPLPPGHPAARQGVRSNVAAPTG